MIGSVIPGLGTIAGGIIGGIGGFLINGLGAIIDGAQMTLSE